jgi:predicted RNase H-like HicB family nuclease
MPYHLAVEDIEPAHWVAWVSDMPGCFATASTEDAAIAHADAALRLYAQWRASHADPIALEEPMDIVVNERFHSYLNGPDYRINACFRSDRAPLADADVTEGCRLLAYAHHDFLAAVQQFDTHNRVVQDIVRHVIQAERWYFSNIGYEQEVSQDDLFAALEGVRSHSIQWLNASSGNADVFEVMQEQWTARKVLRRTLWHERDHTHHLQQMLAAKGEHA